MIYCPLNLYICLRPYFLILPDHLTLRITHIGKCACHFEYRAPYVLTAYKYLMI